MLGKLHIQNTVKRLNLMERQVQGLLSHVQMLHGVHQNLDAQTLLETSNQLSLAGSELEEYLRQLVGETQVLTRRFPPPRSYRARNLAQQIAINPGFASAVGYRNELKALARRLPEEMYELDRRLQLLPREVDQRMSELGRWGDLAAPGPVTDVLSFVFQVLDAIAKMIQRRKSASV
jgi:hypothetical protein